MKRRGLWWWIDRWRASSAFIGMTLQEQGAYRNLLDEQRLRGGHIPNDDRILARACGDPLEWPGIREKILRWFDVSEDGLWLSNKTATEVNAASDKVSGERSEAGRKGAEAVERGDGGRFTGKSTGKPTGNGTGKGSGSVSVAVSVSGSVSEADASQSEGPAPTYALPPDVRTETAIRNQRWKNERELYRTVGAIANRTGKDPGEVMEHVTAYKRRDGSVAPGRKRPELLRSDEAVEKSLADAKAWLANLDDEAAS